MSSYAKDSIPATRLSFLKKSGGVLKLLIFFVSTLSCISLAIAAPTDAKAVSVLKRDAAPIENRELSHPHNTILPRAAEDSSELPSDRELQERSAGLFWGPVYIGNLKLSLTNPHEGYAGPKFPYANHVNFHVDKQAAKNTYTPVVNLHIVKYTSGGKFCLYVWDSVTKKTVFDECFEDFGPAIVEAVSAVKNFVDALLKAADFFAAIVIIAALAVALAAALAGLGAVAVA